MAVHGHTRQAVFLQVVVGDHVPRDPSDAGSIGEHANTRTGSGNLIPIVRRLIIGKRVFVNTVMRSAGARSGRMRSQYNSTIERILPDHVAHNQVVVGWAGVVADQNAVSVIVSDVAGDSGMIHPHDMESATAVEGFVGFKGSRSSLTGT